MKHDVPGDMDFEALALRGNRRDSMFLKAVAHVERVDGSFDIVIRNLSAGGMLADSKVEFAVGENVAVEITRIGKIPGQVAWVQPGRFGVRFDVAVDPRDALRPVAVRPTTKRAPRAAPVVRRARVIR